MKTKSLLIAALLFAVQFSIAQNYVHQVLVLNEGYYDYQNQTQVTDVTIGSYNPANGLYSTVNTLPEARFGSDIKVYGNYYYVAADTLLMKFDLNTHALVNSTTVYGIRKINFWNNSVLLTRGEYLVTYNSYFQVYDINTLQFQWEIDNTSGIAYASEGIVVKNDNAYVAVNNGFDFGNEVGEIAIVDLVAQQVTNNIDLGPDGKNPDNIILDNDNVYTVNNKDYTGSSISLYSIPNDSVTTVNLIGISSGCGTSAFAAGDIYYQQLQTTVLNKFNVGSQSTTSSVNYGKQFYGMAFDDINNLIYAAETDYFSFGEVFVYDLSGAVQDSFDVSISPGNLALDIRTGSGISESFSTGSVLVFPSPANEFIHIVSGENAAVTISNSEGRIVYSGNIYSGKNTIPVAAFATGIYCVQVISASDSSVKSFFKTE